jgi:hypothetical protein
LLLCMQRERQIYLDRRVALALSRSSSWAWGAFWLAVLVLLATEEFVAEEEVRPREETT